MQFRGRPLQDIESPLGRRIVPAERPANRQRFSGNHSGRAFSRKHFIFIEHPAHCPSVCRNVWRRNISVFSYQRIYSSHITTRESFQLLIRKSFGIHYHATFAAAERNIHDGCFPCHPHRKSHHLLARHSRMETDTALVWSAYIVVLRAISDEYFCRTVIHLDRYRYLDHPVGIEQTLKNVRVDFQYALYFCQLRSEEHTSE